MTWQQQLITWENSLKQNDYSYYEFNQRFGIQINKYLNDDVQPRKNTITRIEDAMKKILTDIKIPYHPAYGYATQEQITELQSIGMGPRRDSLMKQISEQTENRGKVYK